MKTAMILAAGRGKRLKPLTDTIPKSLCFVRGMPLIEHHIRHLIEAGFTQLIINHAHLGGILRQYLGEGEKWGVEIQYSPEPTGGLETGGGIVNALPLIGEEPFVIVNADIYTDYPFKQLKSPTNSLAHLVLVNNNQTLNHFGDFGLTDAGTVTNGDKNYTYAGIACFRPEFFKNQAIGRYSVTPIIRTLAQNALISGELYSGVWFDIGSTERLIAANA